MTGENVNHHLDQLKEKFNDSLLTQEEAWEHVRKLMYYLEKHGFAPKSRRWNPPPSEAVE